MASLDFIDENRLLFTFRVPGLLHREPHPVTGEVGEEHHVRALVLALPSGMVLAEKVWTLHDRARYLWMLNNGHFLLRDMTDLSLGDATLEIKPFLRFPGPIAWIELDPSQQFIVTNSNEPVHSASKPGQVGSPSTASADMEVSGASSASEPSTVVRILGRDSGQVMLVSRVRNTVHLPINAEGYAESLRGRGNSWKIDLNAFAGGSTPLGWVDSACMPTLDFIAPKELLADTCLPSGGNRLVALGLDAKRLWEDSSPIEPVWPLLVTSTGGLRLARESLAVNHAVGLYAPLSSDDVKGQIVDVLDAADGKLALSAPVSPVLDGGGNVAISPSGRRVAVLNAGTIQVFDLPDPLPTSQISK
jgi:hypothetical protein